jgi:glycosyltransferase involved in cell wall biosynthesis
MRILQLVQQPQRRGAEMFAYDLTAELLRRGHEVRTVYLYPASGQHALPLRPGDVELAANPGHLFEKLPGVHPGVIRQLRHVVTEFDPDVVQANGARTLKYGAALKRLSNKPRFAFLYRSIGDPLVWVQGRMRRATYRNLLIPSVDGIAAVSMSSLEGLRTLYRIDNKAIAQIPRGIDPSRLVPSSTREQMRMRLGTDPAAPVLVFVGSLTPEKRPDRLARVFAQVLAQVPSARLWVVGDGPERAAMESLLADLSISDKVTLVGSTDATGSYVAAADALILTSDTEGLPGVVLEAAALGLPAVVTAVGGVGDAVEDGVNGLLADPADEDKLAQNAVSLLSDPALVQRLGSRANANFRAKYSISTVADSYLALYEETVKRRVNSS